MTYYNKRFFLVAIIVILGSGMVAGILMNRINQPQLESNRYETTEINFQGRTLNVLLADTLEKRIQGLSGREQLPLGVDGMLFVFDQPGLHGIWMKDMLVDINIYWLDENYEIIDQKLNASPETYPNVFTPSQPSLYVLEIPTE